jgi:hypothetical protein
MTESGINRRAAEDFRFRTGNKDSRTDIEVTAIKAGFSYHILKGLTGRKPCYRRLNRLCSFVIKGI